MAAPTATPVVRPDGTDHGTAVPLEPPHEAANGSMGHDGGHPTFGGHVTNGAHPMNGAHVTNGAHVANGGHADAPVGASCTAPQLRRFIKSRPYVPMHELRRRFGINGGEDDVTPVDLGTGRIFVGLPAREGSLLGELLRGGEIGYELSLDPRSPVVVGLYPMRPVARA
jgi:hypothetical protein